MTKGFSHNYHSRSGSGQIAHAMDTFPKAIPVEEQIVALRKQIERCDVQIMSHKRNGRSDRLVRVESIRSDAVAKLQLAADRFANGLRY